MALAAGGVVSIRTMPLLRYFSPITALWGPANGTTRVCKPSFAHPADAVRTRVVEPAPRLDQHVQAHQQPWHMHSPVVVDQDLIDDQQAALLQRRVRLADQHALRRQVPVVQDQSHDQNIGLRQIILEEVARDETQLVGETVRGDIPGKDRFHRGQIKTAAAEMGVRKS